MELGTYGWNRQVNLFQQHPVFLSGPRPGVSSHALLNLGDGPFDGLSAGAFNTYGSNVLVGINVQSGSYDYVMQVSLGALNSYLIDPYGTTYYFVDPGAVPGNGRINLGSQFYSGAAQFAGSSSGTYLAIGAQSGFAGNFFDCQVAGARSFMVQAGGGVYGLGYNVFGDPAPAVGYAQYNAGTAAFGGSTGGTAYGARCTSAFTGNLADWQVNGTSQFKVSASGDVTATTLTPAKLRGTEALDVASRFL